MQTNEAHLEEPFSALPKLLYQPKADMGKSRPGGHIWPIKIFNLAS